MGPTRLRRASVRRLCGHAGTQCGGAAAADACRGGGRLPEQVLAEDDPLEVFRYSATLGEELNRATQEALTELEVKATATAQITPGVQEGQSHALCLSPGKRAGFNTWGAPPTNFPAPRGAAFYYAAIGAWGLYGQPRKIESPPLFLWRAFCHSRTRRPCWRRSEQRPTPYRSTSDLHSS